MGYVLLQSSERRHMHRFALKATMASIVALTTILIGPIVASTPATLSRWIQHPPGVFVDRPSAGRPCLAGTPGCLSLFQKPPAPCLVSTGRCEVDGRLMNLMDAQWRGGRGR